MTMTMRRSGTRPPAAPHDHLVQFYESEEFLAGVVTGFVGEGLGTGEPVVIIATEPHRRLFVARLAERGFDVERHAASGGLVLLDAEEVLATFMVGAMPDWERFNASVGATIERLARQGPGKVRAYGEMVDVLWRRGDRTAAVVLEEMWNQLGKAHPFSLLCAYVVGGFYKANDHGLQDVCDAHSHVLPAEKGGPSRGASGAPSLAREHVRALAAEVEHRKEVERALREALADRERLIGELQETVRVNERFTAILGHDLRTPLSAIMTSAQLGERLAKGDPAMLRPLGRILSSGERMVRMIDHLLDFTRLRLKQGFPVVPVPVDFLPLVRAALDEHDGTADARRVQLEHLGDTNGTWDPDRLAQVLANLIANAVHHGEQGCAIVVRVDGREADRVRLEVRNRGAIPAALLPRIFEPFVGERSRRSPQGLGLGLFITREIARAHGGDVAVTSTEAEGTTFVVALPRSAGAARGG